MASYPRHPLAQRPHILLGCSGDLVSRLRDGPYRASYGVVWGPVGGLLTGLTKSTDHPSRASGKYKTSNITVLEPEDLILEVLWMARGSSS